VQPELRAGPLLGEERAEVEGAIRKAEATEGTVVVDFRVESEDSVYPMVPSGAALDAMIRRPVTEMEFDEI
jgi:acetolactate synthase-1/2/3 large subunit